MRSEIAPRTPPTNDRDIPPYPPTNDNDVFLRTTPTHNIGRGGQGGRGRKPNIGRGVRGDSAGPLRLL